MSNLTIFDIMYKPYKITKPVRLIELFAGYGSQAFSLKYLGVPFEHWKICEWAVPSIQAYKDAHFTNDNADYSKCFTKEYIIEFLYHSGISMDYNEPMKLEQIKRLSEDTLRTIYNNILATNNLVNIQKVKGKLLDIVEQDKYDYILTYSFPCQDLSLAGKGKGMSRDSGTRSGMLWEVERILDECNELGTLPQILLMENVPQVIGEKNIKDFQSWRAKLESLGYSNYIEVLNAKHYGIPQNRERAFMISILGGYNYTFPKRIPLDKKLKDMLEDNVDEKYYLSDKQINQVINWNAQQEPLETLGKPISPTLTTRSGAYAASMVLTSNLEQDEEKQIGQELLKIKETTKKGYALAHKGDSVNLEQPNSKTRRGRVGNQVAQTLLTGCNQGVVVKDENRFFKQANETFEENDCNEGDTINAYNKTVDKSGVCPTLTTRPEGFKTAILPVVKSDEPKVLGGVGEKKSNGGTQWYQQDRIYDDNVAISVTTAFNPYYKNGLRIRKLTPRECFRLMGIKDEDYENIAKNQSDSKLYHLAGDSIVVNVLMGIFKELM